MMKTEDPQSGNHQRKNTYLASEGEYFSKYVLGYLGKWFRLAAHSPR